MIKVNEILVFLAPYPPEGDLFSGHYLIFLANDITFLILIRAGKNCKEQGKFCVI
jgi:hypothetical protein